MWPTWIALVVFVVGLAGQVSALRCHSCENLCNCLQPSLIDCPLQSQCYTVKRLSDGKITRKGCTTDCNLVNDFDGMCTICRGPNCNTETSLTPMSGPYDECQGDLGQGLGQRHHDGLGQGANQHGGFGQGQGLGQGGLGQPGLGQQGVGPHGLGQGGLGQPSGLGQGGLGNNQGGLGNQGLNYQPAPSIGANNQMGQQRYGDDSGLGQGFNNGGSLGQGYNGLGQGRNNGGLGQGFGNAAARINFNLLALGAALFGLQRL